MTFEEEREFLATWKVKAYEGGILTVSPIHAALEERLGHGTTMSTTYRLLTRHGWRKVIVETSQHENQAAVPGRFSKISPKLWQPVD